MSLLLGSPRKSQSLRSPLALITLVLLVLDVAVGAAALVQRHRLAQPANRVKRGEEAIDKKKFAQVNDIANRLEIDGYEDEAQYLLGKMAFARGQTTVALDALQRVRDQSSVGVEARLLEGRVFMDLKDFGRALRSFNAAVERDPDNAEIHWGLAALYFNAFAYDDSLRECREVARIDDKDGRPYGQMGLILKEYKKFPEAAAAYRKALARNLSDHRKKEVRWELAEVNLALDDVAGAQALLDEDSEDDRRSYTHLVLQADCQWKSDKHDLAIATFEEALKVGGVTSSPRSPGVEVVRYATYLCDNGQAEKALTYLKGFQPNATRDPDFHALLLRIYRDLKMDDDAKKEEKAVQKLEGIRREIDTLQPKAFADITDLESRRKLGELWKQLGYNGLADQWHVAAVALVHQ